MSSNATDLLVSATESRNSLVLTINRPEAGNSISLETARAMRAALEESQGRTDLRGVVITGAGGKFFCAGGDLKAYRALETAEQLAHTFGFVRELLFEIERHPLPVIAAIDGYALGGGAELALACDLRFASRGAKMGFSQSALGLIPGWNGTERLVATVGKAKAMRLLLEARHIPEQEALELGLVDHVTEAQRALDHALTYLEDMRAAPLAARAVKAAVQACSPTSGFDVTSEIFERLWFTEDHREAELAFVEKRRPVFKGR
jgi:enoyl-CoA hydratase/carnithine racemase